MRSDRCCRTKPLRNTPLNNPPQLPPDEVEVTDPTHPLFGRRFTVLSISRQPHDSAVVFVAFVSAPIARRLTRASLAVGTAALVGALVMLLADLVGRRLFAPTELPVGVVTGIVGAPYLLWMLARSNRVGSGG